MPRPKKPPTPAQMPPSRTSHLFGRRKPNDRGAAVTSERIAEDLAAFHRRGGHIEVLGVTRTLTRIDPEATLPEPATDRIGSRR